MVRSFTNLAKRAPKAMGFGPNTRCFKVRDGNFVSSQDQPIRIGYLAKALPSDSGVARYADHFADALRLVARYVYVLPSAHNSSETQRLPVILRVAVAVVCISFREKLDILYSELSGRSLAEFYAVLALSLLRPRTQLWITVHDTPHVTGGAAYISMLDRRGGRRLAHILSKTVGERLERFVLRRAEHVFCLSRQGGEALKDRYGLNREIEHLPHVARLAAPRMNAEDIVVFCPGYIGNFHALAPVLSVLADRRAPPTARIDIGACDEATRKQVEELAQRLGIAKRVRFLGYLTDDRDLDAAFARTSIVVRHQPPVPGQSAGANTAAVSGPIISAMAHGCAIISSDQRAIRESLVDGVNAIDIADRPEDLGAELLRLLTDSKLRQSLGNAAQQEISQRHTPAAVADLLLHSIGATSQRIPSAATVRDCCTNT